jgi:hypothetical protein
MAKSARRRVGIGPTPTNIVRSRLFEIWNALHATDDSLAHTTVIRLGTNRLANGGLVGDGEPLFYFDIVNEKEMKDKIQYDFVSSCDGIFIATNGAN